MPLSFTIIKATETRFSYLFDLSIPESIILIISSISHPKFKLSWVPIRLMNVCKTLFLNEFFLNIILQYYLQYQLKDY